MDFHTRDEYRHSVERIAKHSSLSESAIAHRALQFANNGQKTQPEYPRAGHIGYYLVGKGFNQFIKESGARFPFWERIKHNRQTNAFVFICGHGFPARCHHGR